jgi:cbb3-type cytochrome oxidase cytochrome c subunit
MPPYYFLYDREANLKALPGKIKAQIKLGVPWNEKMTDTEIIQRAKDQADEIAKSLIASDRYLKNNRDLKGDKLREHLAKSEGVALIAYLQKLGIAKEVKKDQPSGPSALNPDSHR